MSRATATPPDLTAAADVAGAALRATDPDLASAFRDHLPRAAGAVTRRLVGALGREGLIDATRIRGDRHAFGRVEPAPDAFDGDDPAAVLWRLAGTDPGAAAVAIELADAAVNLAIAYARQPGASAALTEPALDPDERSATLEKLATEGHNLHPCARTRLGWTVPDLLAYDLEASSVGVGFVAVRRDVHIGDDLGFVLGDVVGRLLDGPAGPDPRAYALIPVHAWQAERIRHGRYADLVSSGVLVPVAGVIDATPTAALRTLLLSGTDPGPRYLKLSLDIQVTSTRRTISVASTRNGPLLSALLGRVLPDGPGGSRVLLMAETAGSACRLPGGRERELSAIVRTGLTGRLGPGEVPVPGAALYATDPSTGGPVVAGVVDRFADTRRLADRSAAALAFVDEYAALLLPPVLALATVHGIGLEAHLQNCVPTFVAGVPHRLALRDLAGLRVHPPRLVESLALWPGSVIVTDDVDTLLAKVAYTALQANLGEVVRQLVRSHALDEPAAWARVRQRVDEVYEGLRRDSRWATRAAYDHAFLTSPEVPHKALLRMRLAAGRGASGDIYVRVENPLR